VKLLVLGANGRTGRLVVQRALPDDWVTALVRTGTLLERRCRLVVGDALDAEQLTNALEGQDAVICTIGPHARGPDESVCRRVTEAMLEGMRRTGVRRAIALTGAMVGHPHEHAGFVYRWADKLLGEAGRAQLEDHRAQERLLTESGLDWTIVRPTRLTDEPARGVYRVGEDIDIGSLAHIGRADLADFLVACAHGTEHVGRAVTIAY
jgi:putative NADH-flavin reductase